MTPPCPVLVRFRWIRRRRTSWMMSPRLAAAARLRFLSWVLSIRGGHWFLQTFVSMQQPNTHHFEHSRIPIPLFAPGLLCVFLSVFSSVSERRCPWRHGVAMQLTCLLFFGSLRAALRHLGFICRFRRVKKVTRCLFIRSLILGCRFAEEVDSLFHRDCRFCS
jgi:hypothetical protein